MRPPRRAARPLGGGRPAVAVATQADTRNGDAAPLTRPGSPKCGRSAASPDDPRLTRPLLTVREVANGLRVPESTFRTWARGYERARGVRAPSSESRSSPAWQARGREASIPFIGVAEGLVLAAFRRSGVPLQHCPVSPAASLRGDRHRTRARVPQALLRRGRRARRLRRGQPRRGRRGAADPVVRSGQRVFAEMVEDYLQLISYATDGFVPWRSCACPPTARRGCSSTPRIALSADPVQPWRRPRRGRPRPLARRESFPGAVPGFRGPRRSRGRRAGVAALAQPPDPEFFLDRSLGRYLVAEALRAAGLIVHTLASVYGEERGQAVHDEEWLALAGARGWAVLAEKGRRHSPSRRARGPPRRGSQGVLRDQRQPVRRRSRPTASSPTATASSNAAGAQAHSSTASTPRTSGCSGRRSGSSTGQPTADARQTRRATVWGVISGGGSGNPGLSAHSPRNPAQSKETAWEPER